MNNFYSELEKNLFNRFKQAIIDSNLTIHSNDIWRFGRSKKEFDIVIYEGNHPLAVIEVKSNLSNINILAREKENIRSAISITNSRFGIITDNKVFTFMI